MSNADINLVIEPWTTANTHFNLIIQENGAGEEQLFAEYAGKTYPLNSGSTFIKLTFNGAFDNNSGNQTANLKFILTDPNYRFHKHDDGIKNHSPTDNFYFAATLPDQSKNTVIVTLSSVDIEKANFSFNFDIKSINGGKDHVFDPDIDIIRPPQ